MSCLQQHWRFPLQSLSLVIFVVVVAFGFVAVFAATSVVFPESVVQPGRGTSFVLNFFFNIGSEVRSACFPVLESSESSSELSCSSSSSYMLQTVLVLASILSENDFIVMVGSHT